MQSNPPAPTKQPPDPPLNSQLRTPHYSMPNCRLVVIDPLSDFLPPAKNRERPDWSGIFKTLSAIAARTGVAIIALMSFIPSTSAAANRRAVATLAAHSGPATVWRMVPDPENEPNRTLISIKNNLAPRNLPLAFELAAPPDHPTARIAWQETSGEVESLITPQGTPPIRVPLALSVPWSWQKQNPTSKTSQPTHPTTKSGNSLSPSA